MKNTFKKLIAALRGRSPEPEYAVAKCGKNTLYALKIKI